MNQCDRIRIVHIQLLSLLSGVQRVSLDILASLDPDRYERHVIAQSEGPFLDAARDIGCKTHVCPRLVRPVNPIADVFAYRQLLSLLKDIQPDLVHTHSSKTGILGRLAAHARGVQKIVHTVHGFAFDFDTPALTKFLYVKAERTAGWMADRLVVVNDEERELAKRFTLAPPDRIIKIVNGTPDAKIDRAAARKAIRRLLSLPDAARIAGTIGRLWPQKNLPMMLRAIARLRNDFPDLHLILIGEGPDEKKLRALASHLEISDTVHFLGFRNDARELMQSFDVYLQTSLREGCSLATLEAMARALPIVATDVRGTRELIHDGDTGILVSLNDDTAMANAVRNLLTDPQKADELGKRARMRQRKDYRYDRYLAEYRNLYETLLDPLQK